MIESTPALKHKPCYRQRVVCACKIGTLRLVSQHQEAGLLCGAMDGSRRLHAFCLRTVGVGASGLAVGFGGGAGPGSSGPVLDHVLAGLKG